MREYTFNVTSPVAKTIVIRANNFDEARAILRAQLAEQQ
jgi:hypothetical protein